MDAREHPLRRRYSLQLALGAAVALAAIAVLVVRDPGPVAPVTRSATSPAVEVSRTGAGLAPAPAADPGRRAPEAAPQVELERESVRAACPPGAFAVDVIDAGGRALPDVPVLLLALERASPDERKPHRAASTRKSDAEGQAFFELGLLAEARDQAALEGFAPRSVLTTYPDLPAAPRLELPDDVEASQRFRLVVPEEIERLFRPLLVRVVDRRGAPVGGIPVCWNAWPAERHADPRAIRHGGTSRTRAEDGMAELSLEILREVRWDELHSGGAHRFRAEVSLPFVGGAPAADLGDPASGETITLVLPETGAVEARIVLPDGTPFEGSGSVRAWGWPASSDEDDVFLGELALADGQATLEHVGLGLELRLAASPDDHGRAAAWVELAGPTRPHQRVAAQLTLGPETTTRLRLQAVDELGAPLPEALLSGTVALDLPENERLTEFGFNTATDAKGLASLRLDGLREIPRAGSIRFETSFLSKSSMAIHGLRASEPLPRLELARENDLGPIVMHGPPPSHPGVVLATGTVLQEDTGTPLANARVNLTSTDADERHAWVASRNTAADGSFEIRGPPGLEHLRIGAFANGHEPGGCDVEAGGNVVVRLALAVSFRARVLLEQDFPRRWLRFVLVSQDGIEVEGELADLEQLRFRMPEPGVHTLEVRTANGPWVIERVKGIRTDASPFGPASDPRLDPLDLRGRLVLSPYLLRDAQGEPLAKERVQVRLDPWGPGAVSTDSSGRLVLVVPAAARIDLEPEGFLPLLAAASREEQTLLFTPR